jgi:hypothetical protein
MNYLTLVNNVLRRIREDEITTINQSPYAALIGDLVNDAKTSVEHSWDWTALRTTVTITTTAGVNEYTLTGFGSDFKYLKFLDNTNGTTIEYQAKDWIDIQNNIADTPLQGTPTYFSYTNADSNGDMKIILYPTPAAAYTLKFYGVVRQAPLALSTDVIKVPWAPVMHLAVAFASRERGETGGTGTAEYLAISNKYLAEAIALDAAYHPEETIFRVV